MRHHDQRTIQQNKAMWLLFDMFATELNGAGFTLHRCIKEDLLKLEVKWTQQNIADLIARPVMLSMWPDGPPDEHGMPGKWINPERPSTTELSTKQLQDMYEVMNAAMGQKFGVSLPFPSLESQYYEAMGMK